MSITITTRQLERLGACRAQVEMFRTTHGDSLTVNTLDEALTAAAKAPLNASWAAERLLTLANRDEYARQRAPLLAEYDRQRASLRAEYQRQRDALLAEYERQRAPLLAEYERQRAPLWAEYQRQRDALLAEYDLQALAVFVRIYWAQEHAD